MPLEESGVNLVVEGLASFLGGLGESNDAIGDLANTAAGVGAAGFDALGGAVSAVGDVVAGAFTAALAVGVAGIAALAGGIAYGIGQAIEAEAAVANLNRMIVNLGEDAPITTQGALDLAAQFQSLALGSDDAVLAIIDLGVKSRNISEEEFPAFIQASLDLGAVMGDNATAARLLARAQEDPLGVLGPLRRQGILFTEEQEAQIKTLQASGDVAGAYAIVMEQVGAVTGGAALTNTQTLSGMIETFKNTIGEAWETIGNAFLPALHAIGDVITTSVLPFITEFATQFANLLMGVSDGSDLFALISDALVAAFGPETGGMVAGVIGQIWDALANLQAFVVANMPFVQSTFEEVFGEVQAVITSLSGLLFNTLIPAFNTIWSSITEGGPTAEEVVDAVLAAVLDFATQASTFITDVLVPAITAAVDWFVLNWPLIQATAEAVFTAIGDVINNVVLPFINDVLIPTMQNMIDWVVTNWPTIQATITTIITAIVTFVTDALNNLRQFWADHGEAVMVIVNGLWTLVSTAFNAALTFISNEISESLTLIKDFWAAWGDEIMVVVDAIFNAIGLAVEGWAIIFNADWQLLLDTILLTWSNMWRDAITAITDAVTIISSTLSPLVYAFDMISEAVERLVNWFWGLVEVLNRVVIPGDLQPGSPTPFETGLRGAADAMAELAKQVNPLDTALAELNRNALSSASAALEQIINPVMVADRAAATPTTINNYNTADIDIHGANVGRNRQTVTDDVLLGLQLGFGLST